MRVNECMLIFMNTYLKSIEALWLRVLASLDDDVSDITFSLRDELYSVLVTRDDIVRMYPKIYSESCRRTLVCIHQIQQVVEEYIKQMSNVYTFFRLSNVVKIKEDVSINKYLSIYDSSSTVDDDQEYDPYFEFVSNNIEDLMRIFYSAKCKMFKNSYKLFVSKIV